MDGVADVDPHRWTGLALLRPGQLVVTGAVGIAAIHAHHTVQVIAACTDMVLEDVAGERRVCRAAVIPPDVPHAVVRGAADGILVHLDPESAVGSELGRLPNSPAAVHEWVRAGQSLCAPQRQTRRMHSATANETSARSYEAGGIASGRSLREFDAISAWLHSLVRPGPAMEWLPDRNSCSDPGGPPRHPAVSDVLRLLPNRLSGGPIRLAELARAVHLSESRLAHVFSSEIGLPFRPYLRWLRLQRAVELIAAGHSLTAVAHGAGFADSAHLTRVCRSMFGAPPSGFNGIRWVTELPPD
ncbi:helix-turn-helix domain-containing protein [Nocardia sp. NPDC057440]|uniref:AraC family transcriptional regulator n=1 Tax=Nocardia sp. NPDC057440 TaxID=3346134 RepID=UPI00366B4394